MTMKALAPKLCAPYLAIAAVSALLIHPIGHAQSNDAAADSGDVVRVVVPFPPGGTTDLLGRLVAENLTEPLNAPVVVENRPGAGGNIGAAYVARADADGDTMLFTATSTPAISATLYNNLNYDLQTDLTPVAVVGTIPFVILVSNDVPAETLDEFIALAKERPGEINFGSAGVGTTAHLAAEMFKKEADIDVVHVPYKGNGPALADLMGGHLDMMFDFLPSAIELVKSGRVRPLAVTSEARAPALPDVPSVGEAGLEGYSVLSYFGLFAPAGTPDAKLDQLNRDISAIAMSDANAARFEQLGVTPAAESREWFQNYVDYEIDLWGELIRDANLQVD